MKQAICRTAGALLCGWLASSTVSAQTPRTQLINRDALAVNPITEQMYAVDEAHQRVFVVDCRSGRTSTIAVGREPDALAIDAPHNRIYVVNAGGGSVSVIDGARRAVIATVPTDKRPYAIALDGTRGQVFVSNTFSNLLTVIDTKTNQPTELPLGSQDFLAVDAPRHRLVMLGYESPKIHVLDEETRAVSTLQAVPHLWGLAIAPATGEIYVPEIGSNALFVASGHTVPTGALPDAVALDPARHRIYIANYGAASVTVVDDTTMRTIANVHVGERPQALVVDARRGLVYVANTRSNTVSVIDGATETERATLAGGTSPYALALDSASGAVFAATYGKHAFFRIPNHALLTGAAASMPPR